MANGIKRHRERGFDGPSPKSPDIEGFFGYAESVKLQGIEAGATADLTADEVRALILLPHNTYTANNGATPFPVGLSLMSVLSSTWPVNDTAHVLTTKHTNTFASQTFTVLTTGARYLRTVGGSGSWGPWINLTQIDWSNVTNKPGLATPAADGFMAMLDKSKLDGIASGAQVNPTDDYIRGLVMLAANSLNADAGIASYPTGLSILLAGASTTGWPAGPNTQGTVQTYKSATTRCTQYYVSGGLNAITWVRSWTGTLETGAWSTWNNVSATMPFSLTHTLATQNVAVGATLPSKVWFATENYDYDNRTLVGNNMTTAAHSRFACRLTGSYKFGAGVAFNAPAGIVGPKYAKLFIRVTAAANGAVTDYLLDERVFRDGERCAVRGVRQILLQAADTVELHAVQDSGSNVALIADKDYTFWWGEFGGV